MLRRSFEKIFSGVSAIALIGTLLPPLPVFASQVAADSLAGYWKLDETSSPAIDGSGAGNSGTWNGDVSRSSTVPSAISFSNPGSGSFDGTGDYILTGGGITFAANAPKAISLWFKSTDASGVTLIHQNSNDFYLNIDSSGHIDSWMNNNQNDFGGSVLDDAWHHLVWVYNGTAESVYIDGAQLGTSNTESAPAGTGNIGIGATVSGAAEYAGLIDDVRIYRRALSTREIAELYSGNHLTAYWNGNYGTGFERARSWSGSYVPDPYTKLVIRATATGSLTLTGSIKYAELTINTGALMNLNGTGTTMNDSGTFTNYGTLALKNTETLTNFTNNTTRGTILITGTGSTTGLKTGTSYYNLTINDGLVAYFPLNETSGTRAADLSGYGNSGALVNGPTISSTVAPVNFHNARSVSFDGSDDYILAPQSALPTGNRARTLSAWIRTSSDTSGTKIPVAYGTCTSLQSFGFYLTGTETLHFWGCSGGDINTGRNLAVNTWYHLTATYDGSRVAVYLNGKQVAAAAKSLDTAGGGLFIGNDGALDAANYAFPGNVDDVRVYNRVLTQGEISALAVGNQPSAQKGTVTLNAGITVNRNLTLNGGTLDAAGSTITVGKSWLNNGSVFVPHSNTVVFDGTSSDLQVLSGGQSFGTLTISGAGGTLSTLDPLTVSGSLILTTGTLDSPSSYSMRFGRVAQGGGTLSPNSGTIALTSNNNYSNTISSTIGTLHVEDPTENGLLAYWKFDEGTNSGSIIDSSGKGNTGVRRGGAGAMWTGASGTGMTMLQFENPYVMRFSGTGNVIRVPSASNLQDWTTGYSYSIWMRRMAISGSEQVIMSYGSESNQGVAMNLYNNRPTFWLPGGDQYMQGTAITDTNWHHLVGSFDNANNTIKLYVDGVLDASAVETDTPGTPTSSFLIGSATDNSTRVFQGFLDDARVYNRALTATEARNLYNGYYADGDSGTATFTLGGDLDLSTLTILSGILSAGSNSIDVSGDWNNYAGSGAFVAGTSTVDFDGNSTQNVRGSTAFATLDLSTSVSKTVNFGSGTTQWISGGAVFAGTSSAMLTLSPLTAGITWYLDLGDSATQSVLYVTPSYSNASAGLEILAWDGTSVDGGNNVNWTFSSSSSSSTSSAAATSDSGGGGGARGYAGGGGVVGERALEARKQILARFQEYLAGASTSSTPTVATDSQSSSGAESAQAASSSTRTHLAAAAEKRGVLMVKKKNKEILYRDVKTTAWYAPYVSLLITDGVAEGYKDEAGNPTGEFGVSNPVTKAEILKMALEAAGKAPDLNAKAAPQNRTARNTWAAQYVRTAEEMKIEVFLGNPDVNKPATRGEVVQIVLQALGFPIGKTTSTFSDVPATHQYSAAIALAAFNGFIEGDTDKDGKPLNTFRPDEPINRAEVAKIIALVKEVTK